MNLFQKLFRKESIDITTDELKSMLKERSTILVIDVRRKREFTATKLSGVTNLDYYQLRNNHSMLEKYKKDKPIVLICALGTRSRFSAKIFVREGFSPYIILKKGYIIIIKRNKKTSYY